jgi:hypothetical protein
VPAAEDFLVKWAFWTMMTGLVLRSPSTAAAVQDLLPTPSNEPVKTGETAEKEKRRRKAA